jgi:hypothetical protein
VIILIQIITGMLFSRFGLGVGVIIGCCGGYLGVVVV